ncbi:MAG: hypothetical protein FWF59_03480 [Turicibacter sp.]|nr:hypothetical protein [Turicibacter sp.]
MFNFNRDFLMGFLSGTVAGAVGYRLYEQNKGELQSLIAADPGAGATLGGDPSLEELVAQKERLEDLIAEKQL